MLDGWNSPYELSSGMTYHVAPWLNNVYDVGVNVGQMLRSPRNSQYRASIRWVERPRPVYTSDGTEVPGLTIGGGTYYVYGNAVTETQADQYMTAFENNRA